MPTIEVNYNDLQSLIGTHVPLDVLQDEGMMYAKGEVDQIEGEMLKLDMKDTNRPDHWSAEGIARELQGRYGSRKGLPKYEVRPSGLVVNVDRRMKGIRPYTVCAVVKNLNITQDVLSQMIQLQEKVSITFGSDRKEVAIGVYDMHKITPPISFTSVKPDGIRFVPLEFTEKMTPAEILRKHPKGKEYGRLLEGMREYPIFIDAAGEVLSMPPIINSDHTGKVTGATRDVFIECSGFSLKYLVPALNVLVAALADRGGEIHSVRVVYPDETMVTPDMTPKKARMEIEYASRLSGLKLTPKRMCELLEQARYDAKVSGRYIDVLYPAYRQDIMHQRDVVEDMLISYGFNRIEPEAPKLVTTGGASSMERFTDSLAEVMVGLGFQETLSYMLTSKDGLFRKMGLEEQPVVEIENVVSSNWCVFRNWLTPGLLEFLSKNKHREYPQNVFEAGIAVVLDGKKETRTSDASKIAAVVCGSSVGYEQIAGVLDALLTNIGLRYSLARASHNSFIDGRVAEIKVNDKAVGIIGEVHPAVLESWEIETPVAAFELDLDVLKAMIDGA
jgi:phenylalanyl-tRNA synthetase beta chain